MTQPTLQKSHFHEILPDGRYKFRIDHHTIHTFSQCEKLFQYRHLGNWRPRSMGGAVAIGSWWSLLMEHFYREMAFGECPAPDTMLKLAGQTWVELDMEHQPPTTAMEKFGGLDGAVIMAMEYYDCFAKADFNNWKIIGAEVGFGLKDEVLVGQTDTVQVFWVGKPDLVIYELGSNKIIPLDHKTVQYVDTNLNIKYKPHPQTTGYIFAAQRLATALGYQNATADRCIINVAARTPPTDKPRGGGPKKPRFIRVYPSYTQGEVEEWRNNIIARCERLRETLIRQDWPMTGAPHMCHVYGGCSYRRVCSVPMASRDLILNADFNQVEPWSPYDLKDVEGDDE